VLRSQGSRFRLFPPGARHAIAAWKTTGKVHVAMNVVAKIMRLLSALRARFRARAEERMLDEVLDSLADAGSAADQDKSDPVGAGEDRGPLMPGVELLFGLLIGVLAVWVLIAMLALLPS
jgi:hypothetical protein